MVTAASRGLQPAVSGVPPAPARYLVRGSLLRVDQVADLKVQGQVWFEVLRIASIYYPQASAMSAWYGHQV
jgi:hypothetical protein